MAKTYFVASQRVNNFRIQFEISKWGESGTVQKTSKGYQKGAILLIVSSNGGNKKNIVPCWEVTNVLKEEKFSLILFLKKKRK